MTSPLITSTRATANGTNGIGIRISADAIIHNTTARGTVSDLTLQAAAALLADNIDYTTSTLGAGATIEPLAGDRSVYDALDYQARHANDINDASGIHHTITALDVIYLHKALTSAHIFVGNGSNVATDVAMSGDVTIDNTGATTIGAKKVDASNIALADAKLLIGGADGAAHEQSMSADATIANTGAVTLATVNANVGTFGDADNVAQVTVNAKGLVTAAVEVAITHPYYELVIEEGIDPPSPIYADFGGYIDFVYAEFA
jgi:hypothetical protein